MAVLNCKMCGGDLDSSEGKSIVEGESCGGQQTVLLKETIRKASGRKAFRILEQI